jgi:hypothetical protein
MDFIESSLCRLKENVRRFVVPSTAAWDGPALRAQIELRQRALTDIEVIRWRLRPFLRSEGARRTRKSSERRSARSRIGRPRQQSN